MKRIVLLLFLALMAGFLGGCQPAAAPVVVQAQLATATNTPVLSKTETAVPNAANTAIPPATQPPPATPSPIPTATATAAPSPSPTPTVTPTATPIGPCSQRIPNGLHTLVTLDYGISREYAPPDLVPLSDYFSTDVTLGYPTEVRQIIVEPLTAMIEAMQAAGLRPFIISGYRSYSTQAIAWDKWNREYPERAAIISSPPGHSEHQLGTTLDFGSPELPEIVGDEDIEFHTYFYKTSEGEWLLQNAHKYGFTLSYPRDAFEATGFYYEPWHYRYVGVELATQLYESGTFLAQYLLETQPLPCVP